MCDFRILTVKQPWASLIASGRKTIELRTWSTSYRGLLVIGSSASGHRRGTSFPIGPKGRALCVVKLVNVRPATLTLEDCERACCAVSPGEFAWELELVSSLPEYPQLGKLSLHRPDAQLQAFVEAHLDALQRRAQSIGPPTVPLPPGIESI